MSIKYYSNKNDALKCLDTLKSGILKRSQTILTLPLRQNPSGQHTINLPLAACKPNSKRVIGERVFGSKYTAIISAASDGPSAFSLAVARRGSVVIVVVSVDVMVVDMAYSFAPTDGLVSFCH